MKQYEYKKISLTTIEEDVLNSLGEDGWQVVHFESFNELSGYDLVLMREKEKAVSFKEPMDMISDLLGKIDFGKGFSPPDEK